jgi:hypothetical protein
MDVALWVMAGVLALAFGAGGAGQILLTKQQYAAVGGSQRWAEDFGPTHIKVIGAIKLLGVVGLIVPPLVGVAVVLSPLAACGLMLVMAGAATTRFRRSEWGLMTGDIAYLTAFALLAWGRFALVRSRRRPLQAAPRDPHAERAESARQLPAAPAQCPSCVGNQQVVRPVLLSSPRCLARTVDRQRASCQGLGSLFG